MTAFEPSVDRPGDDRYVTWDASYVLGSLSSEERRQYEAHLQACARCTAAVAELSGIPALLSKVGPAEFRELDSAPAEPPPELLNDVLDTVRARRRRSRWMASAAIGLAAAVLAVAIAIMVWPGALGRRPAHPLRRVSNWR